VEAGESEPGTGEVPAGGISRFDSSSVYDGLAHTIATNALASAVAPIGEIAGAVYLAYAIGGDEPPAEGWNAVAPSFVDAGEHFVWYRISAPYFHDYLYKAKLTVSKAKNEWLVPPTAESKIADGTPAAVTAGSAKFGSVVVSYSGEGAAAPVKVGQYVAVFVVAETGNYDGISAEIPFEIKSPASSGGVEYETVEEAVQATNSQSPVTFAETPAIDNATHSVTPQGGQPIVVPDYYTLALDGNTVLFALNSAAVPEITSGQTEKGGFPAIDPDVGGSGQVGVGAKTREGLFYTLQLGASLSEMALPPNAVWVAGDGTVLQLSAPKPSPDCGFLRVVVSDFLPAGEK